MSDEYIERLQDANARLRELLAERDNTIDGLKAELRDLKVEMKTQRDTLRILDPVGGYHRMNETLRELHQQLEDKQDEIDHWQMYEKLDEVVRPNRYEHPHPDGPRRLTDKGLAGLTEDVAPYENPPYHIRWMVIANNGRHLDGKQGHTLWTASWQELDGMIEDIPARLCGAPSIYEIRQPVKGVDTEALYNAIMRLWPYLYDKGAQEDFNLAFDTAFEDHIEPQYDRNYYKDNQDARKYFRRCVNATYEGVASTRSLDVDIPKGKAGRRRNEPM